ncbi:hypothetical protein BDY24DRAFT_17610 [Mrakia frigida]|uniref:uncharacterized protein n=1 Tax=Mrakia frigida TaxID=29902 RepID=UPI003FCC0CA5
MLAHCEELHSAMRIVLPLMETPEEIEAFLAGFMRSDVVRKDAPKEKKGGRKGGAKRALVGGPHQVGSSSSLSSSTFTSNGKGKARAAPYPMPPPSSLSRPTRSPPTSILPSPADHNLPGPTIASGSQEVAFPSVPSSASSSSSEIKVNPPLLTGSGSGSSSILNLPYPLNPSSTSPSSSSASTSTITNPAPPIAPSTSTVPLGGGGSAEAFSLPSPTTMRLWIDDYLSESSAVPSSSSDSNSGASSSTGTVVPPSGSSEASTSSSSSSNTTFPLPADTSSSSLPTPTTLDSPHVDSTLPDGYYFSSSSLANGSPSSQPLPPLPSSSLDPISPSSFFSEESWDGNSTWPGLPSFGSREALFNGLVANLLAEEERRTTSSWVDEEDEEDSGC